MKILDCRGMVCPEPVIRTRAALAEPGLSELQVIVDNDAARGNVSRFAANNGWAVSVDSRDQAHYLTLTSSGSKAATPAGDATLAAQTERSAGQGTGGTVVLVTAATFGRGDDALGSKLMASFFFALTEADRVPSDILFLNGGVRLTTGDTPLKAHLIRLSERGSLIMSCGTCLDFFGLKDQLVVGEVTNMYSIVEACQRAARVITI